MKKQENKKIEKDFFFPSVWKTIRASDINEAKKILFNKNKNVEPKNNIK